MVTAVLVVLVLSFICAGRTTLVASQPSCQLYIGKRYMEGMSDVLLTYHALRNK